MDLQINEKLPHIWKTLFPSGVPQFPTNFAVSPSKNPSYGDFYTNLFLRCTAFSPDEAATHAAAFAQKWNESAETTDIAIASSRSIGFVNFQLPHTAPVISGATANKTKRDFGVQKRAALQSAVISLKPIGVVRTPFRAKYATPRQGLFVPHATGTVELLPEFNEHWLTGLDEYSHCWLVFAFHENGDYTPPPQIKVPKADHKIGTFATRTPHRPNPLGLSLCKIDRVMGRRLEVSGVDLVDNTPLLDIKPYHPLDSIAGTSPSYVSCQSPCPVELMDTESSDFADIFACCNAGAIVKCDIPAIIRSLAPLCVGLAKSKVIDRAGTAAKRQSLQSMVTDLNNALPKNVLKLIDEIGQAENKLRCFSHFTSLTSFLMCLIESLRLDPRDRVERVDDQGKYRRVAHNAFLDNFEVSFYLDESREIHECRCGRISEAGQKPTIIIHQLKYDSNYGLNNK